MLCEQCGKNQAAVHMTKVVNNQKQEAHLCSECAKQFSGFHSGIDFSNMLSSMFGPPQIGTACPTCHSSLADVQKRGQLGCSDCYQVFRQELSGLLRKIHGTTNHMGKVPAKGYARVKAQRQLEGLRQQLQTAVSRENYEQAAELRDEIRRIEGEMGEKKPHE